VIRRRFLLPALIVLCATAALAQQFPTMQRGLSMNKEYSLGDIDAINSFNGNLSLSIPIGFDYPVNGAFKYKLTLHYNSKVWDYEQRNYTGSDYTSVVPNRDSNAGMGWLLDFGRLASPHDSSNPLPDDQWSYLSPDGNRHSMTGYGPHPGSQPTALSGNVTQATYSSEGDYLRMLNKSDGTEELDTPDGIKRTFDPSTGNLTTMSDPFGNMVTLTKYYSTSATPCPSSDASAWAITDNSEHPRTHYVCFANSPFPYTESAYDNQWVERVILAAPGGQQAIYRFSYTFMDVTRGCDGNYPYDPASYVNLPMLTGLVLPDGSTYAFDYNRTPVNGCEQGTLKSVTLPTQATISYVYREYMVPVDPCPPNTITSRVPRTFSDVVGVGQKTISGPNIPANTMVWTWTSSMNNSTYFTQCTAQAGPYEVIVYPSAPSDQMVVTVTDPDHNVTEHYYSVWPGAETRYRRNADGTYTYITSGYPLPSENGALINEYGLPFTRLIPSGTRFLSTRRYKPSDYAAGTPTRSEFVHYEYDDKSSCFQLLWKMTSACLNANQRPNSREIVYHEDGRTADTDFYDFDGFGNYRKTVTNGTFASGNVRTSFTDYNPGADANGNLGSNLFFSSSANWIVGTYGDQWVNENNHTSKTENCFAATGNLRKKRVLLGDGVDASSVAENVHDVVVVYDTNSAGNLVKERWYGGDTCGTSVLINGCGSAPSCPPTGVALCNVLDSGVPAYDIHRSYSNGALATQQYYQCDDTTPASFKSVDRVIDPVGLVTTERDSASVATQYTWDTSGRVVNVAPAGEAAFGYTYTPATLVSGAFTPATVIATRSSAAAQYQYDALGRPWREKEWMPDNTWSLGETLYDAMGRKATESVFQTIPGGANPPSEFTFHPSPTVQYSYDYDNRPTTITGPDGSQKTISYTGVSSTTETILNIASPSGPVPAKTVRTFDRQGRMVGITKGADTALSQTTTYGYDVGSRLSSVQLGVQPRSFVYDGRGFLTSETHPENGTTTYTNYDAKGHVGQKLLPGQTLFDLQYNYDSAERLWLLQARNPYSPTTFRTLKQFTFGQANSGSDLVNGKLQTALRKNYDPSLGTSTVIETLHYTDTAGHLTAKDTSISGDYPIPTQSMTQSYTYNELGQRASATYPRCTGTTVRCGQSTWSSPMLPDGSYAADVTESYTNGFLSSASAPFSFRPSLASLSYGANGTVSAVVHANGVTDTQTPDPSGLPRTQSISVTGWSSCTPPSITVQPADKTLQPGNSGTTLSVTATGTGTLHYVWTGPFGPIPGNDYPTLNTGAVSQTSYYSVKVADDCGVAQSRSAVVTVCDSPTATVSGSTTIAPGGSATIQAALTGTAPWAITWSDGLTWSGITASPFYRTVSPSSTTTYSVTTIRDNYCEGTSSGSATVTTCTSPTATVSGGGTILPGGSATIQATLTGTAPWTVTWSDGFTASNITSSSYSRTVSDRKSVV